MLILVTYDVSFEDLSGQKRLRKVAKICTNFGVRVQNSVFECIVDSSQLLILKNNIQKVINLDKDSVRFYHLGSKYENKVEHIGVDNAIKVDKPLIF